ncbi:hypothetical protein ACWEPL_30585 [Nonomuraea sp. NPDC004186]
MLCQRSDGLPSRTQAPATPETATAAKQQRASVLKRGNTVGRCSERRKWTSTAARPPTQMETETRCDINADTAMSWSPAEAACPTYAGGNSPTAAIIGRTQAGSVRSREETAASAATAGTHSRACVCGSAVPNRSRSGAPSRSATGRGMRLDRVST